MKNLQVHWLDWSGSGQGQVVDTCEQVIEPLGSINSKEHFRLSKELLASQAGPCSIELAGWLVVSIQNDLKCVAGFCLVWHFKWNSWLLKLDTLAIMLVRVQCSTVCNSELWPFERTLL